jgi:hypothetical protein
MIKVIFKKKTDIKEDEVNLHNCKIKPDKIKTIKNYGFGFFSGGRSRAQVKPSFLIPKSGSVAKFGQ